MATYYRWRKSSIIYTESTSTTSSIQLSTVWVSNQKTINNNNYTLGSNYTNILKGESSYNLATYYIGSSSLSNTIYQAPNGARASDNGSNFTITPYSGSFTVYKLNPGAGELNEYVYSNSSSAYPMYGGVSGDYYYDQRTAITSPTAPTALTYPIPITSFSIDVSWEASISNVPAYTVTEYEVSYSINEENTWTVAGTTTGTSLNVKIPSTATSIQFRVRAKDSNNQWSSYATGSTSQVLVSPTLTVPSLAMQGQNIMINWSAIDGATSYTLQRKADIDNDWIQVYSGSDLTFTEVVGEWSNVQYRVNAVFSSGTGEWATSNNIPVISASTLAISGTDEDLGTLINDISYTISTDTGKQITVKTTVNGAVIFDGTIPSGTAETISVLDLINGTGTIIISATVDIDSGPVSATRTWTYTKAPITFLNSGSVGQLQKNGKNIWPITLAEAVRTAGGIGLNVILDLLSPLIQSNFNFEIGAYTGTGTYGTDSPTIIKTNFKPDFILLCGDANDIYTPQIVMNVRQKNKTTIITTGSPVTVLGTQLLNFEWRDDEIAFWTLGSGAQRQFNTAGQVYPYLILGGMKL